MYLPYCCPICKSDLDRSESQYACSACSRVYPIVVGIPDFRVFPDPYISISDDHKKGMRLAERAEHVGTRDLVEYYWSMTPETPANLASRFIRHAMAGDGRAKCLLDDIEARNPQVVPTQGAVGLELGCRSGGALLAMDERCSHVVGIDIAFRWLVVAKKRMAESSRDVQLVCCCAEHLPFADETFDLVLAENVIEHTARQQALLAESFRVLKPGRALLGVTVNRWSLAGEPHVRVWGVGWLPRRWMSAYVKLRRGVPYENVRLLSLMELGRMLRAAAFRPAQVRLPRLADVELEGLGSFESKLARAYNRIKDWPVIHRFLLWFGPALQFVCLRPKR